MTVLGFIVRLSKMALSPLYCLAVGKNLKNGYYMQILRLELSSEDAEFYL